MLEDWRPPPHWKAITTIDAHTAGEPLRIITGGLPRIPGKTILGKRRYFLEKMDHFRKGLIWEPRGHADMYGAVITEPVTSEADLGVLFLHNEGLSTMCGHGIIALATVVVETGEMPVKAPFTEVRMDTPAGLVTAYAKVEGKRVKSVAFRNVPSFVLALDETVDVPALGKVRYDLAFGGAFYAYVQAEEVGMSLSSKNLPLLVDKGMAIKRAIADTRPILHPADKDLSFLYGTIFVGSPQGEGSDSRNVCIFAEGEVDRSPTGTGVSGCLAIEFARGKIVLNQEMVVESIIGTRFKGRIVQKTRFGERDAVIPEVEGSAYITGKHQFLFDPDDPLASGFFLR